MTKKSILAVLAVFSICFNETHPICDIPAMIKVNNFQAVEREIKQISLDKKQLNAMLEALCMQFGKTVTTENFEQAYVCLQLLLQKGAQAQSTVEDDYYYEPIILALNHMQLVFKQADDALLHEGRHIHSEPFSIADSIGDVIADSAYRNAVISQTCRLVTLLVEYGASPNFGTDDWITSPLYYASFFDSPELIEALLKLGANPNDINDYFFNIDPLMTCKEKRQAYTRVLAETGINPRDLIGKYSYIAVLLQRRVLKKLNAYEQKGYKGYTEKETAGLKLRKVRCEKMLTSLKQHGAKDNLPKQALVWFFKY